MRSVSLSKKDWESKNQLSLSGSPGELAAMPVITVGNVLNSIIYQPPLQDLILTEPMLRRQIPGNQSKIVHCVYSPFIFPLCKNNSLLLHLNMLVNVRNSFRHLAERFSGQKVNKGSILYSLGRSMWNEVFISVGDNLLLWASQFQNWLLQRLGSARDRLTQTWNDAVPATALGRLVWYLFSNSVRPLKDVEWVLIGKNSSTPLL